MQKKIASLLRSLRLFMIIQSATHGYRAFLAQLAQGSRVLDVGCGNNSPFKVKRQRPDIHYTGLDIADYNQTATNIADQYIVVPPEEFADAIENLRGCFDAVISSHNIEHCLEPDKVIRAMVAALRPGGAMYLSFPSERSVTFPSRAGTLNYYDDRTHRDVPRYASVIDALRAAGCELVVAYPRYRPILLRIIGALQEPYSRLRGRTMFGTWSYFGFESVIWAIKKK